MSFASQHNTTADSQQIRLSRDFLIASVIFAFALSVRLIYFFQAADNPAFSTPIIDSAKYHAVAHKLATEGVMGGQFFWQSFFYQFFLSRLYSVTGSSITAAKLFNFLLGSVTASLVYVLGKKLFGRQAGVIAALIFALYGPCIAFEAELLAVGWACFFSALLVLLLIKTAERGAKNRLCLLAGTCAGLSIITQAPFVPFVFASGIWLVWKLWRNSANARSAVFKTLSFIGPAAAIPTLVGLLAFMETGAFSPLPQSGAVNLYIGNNPNSEQTIMIRPGEQWRNLMALPIINGAEEPAEQSRFFMQLFLDYVKNHPADFLKGLLDKASQFCTSREVPRNIDIYIYRKFSPLLSILLFKIGRFGFPFGLLLPLAITGIALNFRRIPPVLLLLLLLYPLSLILVFICSRYRLPIIPILCLPAAVAVVQIAQALKDRRFAKACLLILVVAVLAGAFSLDGPFVQEKYDYESEMYYCTAFELYEKADYAKAYEYVSKAIAGRQDYADAYALLGFIYAQTDKPALAVENLSKSLEINPEPHIRRLKLAENLLKLNRPAEAKEQLIKALADSEKKKDYNTSRNIQQMMAQIPEPNALPK
jgi:4-amino-4-deoxy-L-arabinose transferase-like glycosyltransferase